MNWFFPTSLTLAPYQLSWGTFCWTKDAMDFSTTPAPLAASQRLNSVDSYFASMSKRYSVTSFAIKPQGSEMVAFMISTDSAASLFDTRFFECSTRVWACLTMVSELDSIFDIFSVSLSTLLESWLIWLLSSSTRLSMSSFFSPNETTPSIRPICSGSDIGLQ